MRTISRLSNGILGIEQRLVTWLVAAVLLLILLNVVTRALGAALFWVDELAIYTTIWMALFSASAMVRMRVGVSVTLVVDLLPAPIRRMFTKIVDAIILIFAIAIVVLCWLWYDPIALVQSGFDFDLFAQNTFKFIYSEPTNTIGIKKFWIWLAMPLMAVNMSIHALANLIEPRPVEPDSATEAAGSAPRTSAA